MRAVIQRVSEASVTINGKINASIGQGFVVLLGIGEEDTEKDARWLAGKIAAMRIFSDNEGKLNLAITDIFGALLVISQFTLIASTRKGNRPSFIKAARPEIALPLYAFFIQHLQELTKIAVQTGEFGADMKVSLVNDGPVTIIIDSHLME